MQSTYARCRTDVWMVN